MQTYPGQCETGQATCGSSPQPSAKPPVAEALARLDSEIGELSQVLGHLNSRLGSVMAPKPTSGGGGKVDAAPSYGAIHDSIQIANARLRELRTAALDMIDALAI